MTVTKGDVESVYAGMGKGIGAVCTSTLQVDLYRLETVMRHFGHYSMYV